MAARDATKLLMSAQSPHATERPTGTPPVGKFAWTDRTSLPFDMDAIYVSCYSGSVSSDANSLKTSRWADSSGVKAVATALRKMHDDKVSVERLAPVAQFIVNCTAWGKMKAAMLDEPRLMRQLGVIETATTNVATAKRVLKDTLTDEISRSCPSGGLLSFYAALSREAEKKLIALDGAKLQTEKLRRNRREALDAKARADAAEAEAAVQQTGGGGGGGRTNSGQKGLPGGPSPVKPAEWSELEHDISAICYDGYDPPIGSSTTALASSGARPSALASTTPMSTPASMAPARCATCT